MRRSAVATLTAVSVVVAGGLLAGTHADAAVAGPCGTGGVFGNPLPRAASTASRIKGGFTFLEGPTWDAATGTLLMSDIRNPSGSDGVQGASLLKFTPPATVQTLIANSGSNGLAITADSSAVLAATQDKQEIASFKLSDLSRTTAVANTGFNSPNDLTIRSDGTVYFTDPNFQRGRRTGEPTGKTSVFRVTGKTVTLVDDTVKQPNGIVLSPDEKTLYVGANAENVIYAYPVRPDGSTGPRTRFATISQPDGATVDCAGNLYWASYSESNNQPGMVHVFTPAGREIGTIAAGRNTTNAAFGGADRKTLFITSGTNGDFGLYSIRLNVPGFPY